MTATTVVRDYDQPTPAMKPEVKELWLQALRSGDYKQGTGVLHTPAAGTYCCLGVLCDLAVKHSVIPAPTIGNEYARYGETPTGYRLPAEVMAWADLGDAIPTVYQDGAPVSVAYLNDSTDLKFTDIADLIEENL